MQLHQRNPYQRSFTVLCIMLGMLVAECAQLRAQVMQLTRGNAIDLALQNSEQSQVNKNLNEINKQQYLMQAGQTRPQVTLSGNIPGYNNIISSVTQPDGTIRFTEIQQGLSTATLKVSQQLAATGGEIDISSALTRFDRYTSAGTYKNWQTQPVLIGLNQPIFRFNESRYNLRMAKLNLLFGSKTFAESQQSMSLQVIQAFFGALYAQENLLINEYNAKMTDTLLQFANSKHQYGKIGEEELLQIELQSITSRNNALQAGIGKSIALAQLKLMLNIDPQTTLQLLPEADLPSFQTDSQVAVEQALLHSKDVTQWKISIEQATANFDRARLGRLPNFNLTASYGLNQSAPMLSDAYKDLLRQQAVSLGFNVPVFSSGVNSAGYKAARYQLDNQKLQQSYVMKKVAQDINSIVIQLNAARQSLQIQLQAQSISARRYLIAKDKFLTGRITYNELLIAQNEKDKAQLQTILNMQTYWVLFYTLRTKTLYDFEKGERLYTLDK